MTIKSCLILSGAVVSFCPASVLAQDAAADGDQFTGLEEVVVTAQRREQKLQDVPISVTALTSAELTRQGVTSTHDIAQSVPGMTITESGGYVQPFIRGVGSTVTNLGEPGSAATYIDGVYMPTVNGQLYELANIESIQVLKGPQGTLFGRNANTGAILITTRQPQQEPAGTFTLSYGNLDAIHGAGFLTGGLGERVAASIAVNYDRHDSWFINRNPANGLGLGSRVGKPERYTTRAALQFRPTDDLKITLSGDIMRGNDPSPIIIQPYGGGYQGFTPGAPFPQGPYDYVGNEDVDYETAQEGVSAAVEWNLADVLIRSTTAFRSYRAESFDYDSDTTPTRFTAISNRDVGDNFTQEILISSDQSEMLSWVIGGFYLRQDGRQDPLQVDFAAGRTVLVPHQLTDAWAGFADATLKLGNFDLTGGLRYSRETKDFEGTVNGATPPAYANGGVSKTWTSWTPRAVISYHVNPDAMIYASFSQGFKSGAFNSTTLSPVPIDPEQVDAYEAGFKLTLDRRFSVNAAVFHYDTSDLQVQALNSLTNLIELRNAAKVKSDGVDLEVAYTPVDDFNLRLGMSYLKAEFSRFPNAQVFLPVPNSDGRNASAIVDVTGKRNVRSPERTVNLAADYRIELSDGGSIVPSASVYYSSKFYWTVDNRLFEPSHVLVNASLTWNLPGDALSLAVWGRNITDEVRFRNVSATTQADRRAADEPALYGVRATYRF